MSEISIVLLGLLSFMIAGFGLLLIPFSLPGNWIIAAAGLLGPTLGLGWTPLLVLLAAAAVAEILELLLATKTAKRAGAGKSGQWGAFFGGIVGAIFATPFIPIPILGTLIGAAAGAFGGAVLFEIVFANRESRHLMGIGFGAFFGILLGKGAKMVLGAFQIGYWGYVVFAEIWT
ncbi:MAG: hypothetical protein COA70_00190 [Planctomycetota bacterium]|nr:MAG: hypothetical protein COA70_00190 [Planctomycetota bacterium]